MWSVSPYPEVVGTVAPVTHSKVSKPAPDVTNPGSPMPETEPDSQMLEEPVHAPDLSHSQTHCVDYDDVLIVTMSHG